MDKQNSTRIFIIAGEASGDLLGSKLIKSITIKNKNIEFYGIGGDLISNFLSSLFPMSELSITGFVEIIPFIPRFIFRIIQTILYIRKINPDIILTIDSPGFNFSIVKILKLLKTNAKLIHYVAPTVWAYKPERAKKIAKLYDHLLVILPWEKPYFTKENLSTSYIGHPIIEEYNLYHIKNNNFRNDHNIFDQKIITLLPGSRSNEIKILLPIFIAAINIISRSENIMIVIPIFKNYENLVNQLLKNYNGRYLIIDQNDKYRAISASDAAIVKSGTVSFEVAMANVPMVIAYKINKLSALLIRKFLKINLFNLINIINKKNIIPEYIQEDCTPEKIAEGILNLINSNDSKIEQIEATENALDQLGINSRKPSSIAAEIILDFIDKKL